MVHQISQIFRTRVSPPDPPYVQNQDTPIFIKRVILSAGDAVYVT